MKKENVKKVLKIGSLILVVFLTIYFYFDYVGPNEIRFSKSVLFGFESYRAKDLMIQTSDDSGNIYASRGMIIYKLKKGDFVFKKIAHVPTGISVFWFRNFSFVRKFTMRPECVEMVASGNGSLCVMSAGKIWYKSPNSDEFVTTHSLKHYNKGNQGIFNNGILQKTDSTVYYGEYFRNENFENVNVYESKDGGASWHLQHSFLPKEIRHIHAIQKDPYTGTGWICTGDNEKNSKIGYTLDNFKTFNFIGVNSEKFTATQLSFTPDYVYWGADPFTLGDVGVFRWNKKTHEVEKITSVRSCVFYTTQLKNGTLVFTTNREATEFENDLYTRMIVVDKFGNHKTFNCGIWNKRNGFFRQYAKLRLPRQQSNSPYLFISVLKHKDIDDNDLFLISENELLDKLK